jgi:hypothetical protein
MISTWHYAGACSRPQVKWLCVTAFRRGDGRPHVKWLCVTASRRGDGTSDLQNTTQYTRGVLQLTSRGVVCGTCATKQTLCIADKLKTKKTLCMATLLHFLVLNKDFP